MPSSSSLRAKRSNDCYRKQTVLGIALTVLALLTGAAAAADRVAFGLDWKAEAEYGGFYQALATGLYAKHGLDVTIRQGGPQVNQTQLLLAGRLDFTLTSNGFLALNLVRENLPFTTVAAVFQRDPAVLIAHPGVGHDSFESLRNQPVMISADSRAGWWNYLRSRFGYTDSQIRPYTFNLAPFLADKNAVQQGYLGSEPYAIKQEAGFDPVVLLLADAGFSGYGSLITTSTALIDRNPDLIQRFLDASFEGWASYLDGNPAPAHALIKAENPEMTDGLLAFGRQMLRDKQIVQAASLGSMTESRWEAFFRSVQKDGGYPADMDWHRAFTLRFQR